MYYLQNEDFAIKREGDKIVFIWKDIAKVIFSVDMAQEWLLNLIDNINSAVNQKMGVFLYIGIGTDCTPEFAENVMNAVKLAISDIIEKKYKA